MMQKIPLLELGPPSMCSSTFDRANWLEQGVFKWKTSKHTGTVGDTRQAAVPDPSQLADPWSAF